MSLARSGTRRIIRTNTLAPNSANPNVSRKTLDDIKQGIKVLYAPATGKPEVDIVFVPGLGADPERSWQSSKSDFNWTKDPKEGLARDYPKARFLLFQYESSWTGGLKVKQNIYNIAITLLVGLRSTREQRSNAAIVLIGHSMGGLVIAKAITIADSRRDQFPAMFECISGCVFFGTPFGGTEAASAASILAAAGEKYDKATSPKLLEMMSPRDEGLKELKNEFVRLAGKLTQKIEIWCFYEEQPTNFAEQAGLPSFLGWAIPKKIANFVTEESATLVGIDKMGLASNHRNLVKFDSPKDPRFQMVRDILRRIIHGSQLVAKARFNATRNVDKETLRDVKKALAGSDVQYTRRALNRKQAVSSWLVSEQEYLDWVSDELLNRKRVDAMWIRGQVGRGKTSNVLAVLNDLEAKLSNPHSRRQPLLLAYFFCEEIAERSTAEDILKSFLRQLVEQQETLAPYAKQFAKKRTEDESKEASSKEASRSALQLTVENMWQSIQDMLYDEFAGSGAFFIINNIHVLPQDSPSTQKLLEYIRADLTNSTVSNSSKIPVRWLLSSRKMDKLTATFEKQTVRLVDLEDEKYESQVQKELKKHAYFRVSALTEEKKYNRDVAYFAHSLIGKRAQNTQWIDIACLQLKALSPNDSRHKVRQILDTMPQDLNMLLESAWQQVFRQNINVIEQLKEMLRAMVLTFEDPTASELEILADMPESDEEGSDLRQLVEKCKPLLTTRRDDESDIKIGFMNIVVKTHLLENSGKLLGLYHDETEWQHGMLAFRAFDHLTTVLAAIIVPDDVDEGDVHEDRKLPDDDSLDALSEIGQPQENVQLTLKEGTIADAHSDWSEDLTEYSDDDLDEYEDDDEMEEYAPEAAAVRDMALAYTVKYWLKHAEKANKDVCEDLTIPDDSGFWNKDSDVRRRWLLEFTRLDGRLKDMPFWSHSGLHVAASIGFPHLVSSLIKNGHKSEVQEVDEWENTPLHLAAYHDQVEIIDVLLEVGAELDHGKQNGDDTPLHMAAYAGFVQVMKKLIDKGADIDAFAEDIGPVINSAIASGNREAVELMIKNGAKLSIDAHNDIDPPLAAAARISDTALFDYLISACADRLPTREYNLALVAAAGAGQEEVFRKLLAYNHSEDTYQKALTEATKEIEWDIVKIILESTSGLDCHYTFIEASTAWDDQSTILQAIWRYTRGTLSINTINNALYEATDFEKEDVVRLLLTEFGADANAEAPIDKPEDEENYGNALTASAYDGTINIVKLLLERGAKINAKAGWPLHAAAAQGHLEVLQELLDRGANVNTVVINEDFDEGTALQAACKYGHTEIVELLLKHGADPNLGGGELAYPLIAATFGGEEKITELLLQSGAKVNVFGTVDRSTPLINAAMWLPIDSVKLLLEAGAVVNTSDDDGNSPLTAAAAQGDAECIEFLLDNGADIMHTNNEGLNALQIALQEENEDCMQILVDAVSRILASVKIAVDAGNTAVSRVLRSAGVKTKAMDTKTENYRSSHQNYGNEYVEDEGNSLTSAITDMDKHDPTDTSIERASRSFSFDEKSPGIGEFRQHYDYDIQSQQSSSDVIDSAHKSYERSERRGDTSTPPVNSKWKEDRSKHDIPLQSLPQQTTRPQTTQDSYGTGQAASLYPRSVVTRKPTPGTSPSPSRPSVTMEPIVSSTLPLTSYNHGNNYSSSTDTLSTAAPGYQGYATSSQSDAYQARASSADRYGQGNVPSDYSTPYTAPSRLYQAYNSTPYGQPAYQSYSSHSSPGFSSQTQPTQRPSQQHTNNYNSYDGSDYGSSNWLPPPLPPRVEQRRSSGALHDTQNSFDNAKQYGANRWRS